MGTIYGYAKVKFALTKQPYSLHKMLSMGDRLGHSMPNFQRKKYVQCVLIPRGDLGLTPGEIDLCLLKVFTSFFPCGIFESNFLAGVT